MAEVKHPPMLEVPASSPTQEHQLAVDMWSMLAASTSEDCVQFGEAQLGFLNSERYDVPTESECGQIALRLSSVPSILVHDDNDGRRKPRTLRALELEWGTALTEEPECDDDYDWNSYVAVILDEEDCETVDVVYADTGRKLDDLGLMRAAEILGAFNYIKKIVDFEEALEESELKFLPRMFPRVVETDRFKVYDAGQPADLSDCDHCVEHGTGCVHTGRELN